MKRLSLCLLLSLAAGSISIAQAANVGFAITEAYSGSGSETASASWSSDPSAVITVTRDTSRTDGEVWLIVLPQSHQVPGAGWPFGFTVATWTEVEHPGLWNNLHIDDAHHMHLESEWPVATGQNMGTYPNGFGNGVSYFAGFDVNGDHVFVSVSEAVSTPTRTSTWGRLKSLYRR